MTMRSDTVRHLGDIFSVRARQSRLIREHHLHYQEKIIWRSVKDTDMRQHVSSSGSSEEETWMQHALYPRAKRYDSILSTSDVHGCYFLDSLLGLRTSRIWCGHQMVSWVPEISLWLCNPRRRLVGQTKQQIIHRSYHKRQIIELHEM